MAQQRLTAQHSSKEKERSEQDSSTGGKNQGDRTRGQPHGGVYLERRSQTRRATAKSHARKGSTEQIYLQLASRHRPDETSKAGRGGEQGRFEFVPSCRYNPYISRMGHSSTLPKAFCCAACTTEVPQTCSVYFLCSHLLRYTRHNWSDRLL